MCWMRTRHVHVWANEASFSAGAAAAAARVAVPLQAVLDAHAAMYDPLLNRPEEACAAVRCPLLPGLRRPAAKGRA